VRFCSRLFVGVCSAVFVFGQCFQCSIVSAADDIYADHVAKQLHELGVEYKKLEEARSRAFPPDGGKKTNDDLSDEEWLRLDRATESIAPLPDTELLPKFLALAKQHPASPYSFDALAFVIRRGGPATGDVVGKPWQLKEQALDLLQENHMGDPRIVHVFDILDGSLPSRKTEA